MTAVSVYRRMVAILEELPAIGKNQKNVQQGFMFRGHDDILNALNPLLAKHGVVVVPDVLERETAQRTTSKGGVMYEVNLHVRYRFYGLDGDCVEATVWGEGTDSGDKATNKAMTMAFKNVLNQAFAISSAEFGDADADTPVETTGRKQGQPPARPSPPEEEAAPLVSMPAQNTDPPKPETKKLVKTVMAAVKDLHPDWNVPELARTITQAKFNKQDSSLLTDAEMVQLAAALERKLEQKDPGPVAA